MRPIIFDDRGYTTLELMIALQLSLLLISIIYLSWLFVSVLTDKWEAKTESEELLSAISGMLSVKINAIRQFSKAESYHFSATDNNGDTLIFTLNKGLEINGHLFQHRYVRLTDGNFRYIIKPSRENTEITTLEFLDLPEKPVVIGVEYNLKFLIHHRIHHIKSVVYLQKYKYRHGWIQNKQDEG